MARTFFPSLVSAFIKNDAKVVLPTPPYPLTAIFIFRTLFSDSWQKKALTEMKISNKSPRESYPFFLN
jgi:hypothetical protein